MTSDDIPSVYQLATRCFPTPWSIKTYYKEIEQNRQSHYWIAQLQRTTASQSSNDADPKKPGSLSFRTQRGPILSENLSRIHAVIDGMVLELVGYGGYWLVAEEMHIVSLAIAPQWQRRGLGKWLLINMLEKARRSGIALATLEVRSRNQAAQLLYSGLGFETVGRRKNYYPATKLTETDDAILFTLKRLDDGHIWRPLATTRDRLMEKLSHLLSDEQPQ